MGNGMTGILLRRRSSGGAWSPSLQAHPEEQKRPPMVQRGLMAALMLVVFMCLASVATNSATNASTGLRMRQRARSTFVAASDAQYLSLPGNDAAADLMASKLRLEAARRCCRPGKRHRKLEHGTVGVDDSQDTHLGLQYSADVAGDVAVQDVKEGSTSYDQAVNEHTAGQDGLAQGQLHVGEVATAGGAAAQAAALQAAAADDAGRRAWQAAVWQRADFRLEEEDWEEEEGEQEEEEGGQLPSLVTPASELGSGDAGSSGTGSSGGQAEGEPAGSQGADGWLAEQFWQADQQDGTSTSAAAAAGAAEAAGGADAGSAQAWTATEAQPTAAAQAAEQQAVQAGLDAAASSAAGVAAEAAEVSAAAAAIAAAAEAAAEAATAAAGGVASTAGEAGDGSPYESAVQQCDTLSCLTKAASKQLVPGQFRFPHFMLLSWQVGASSALSARLAQHPSVQAPSKQDPEFFAYDCEYDPLSCPLDKQKDYIEETLQRDQALAGGLRRAAFEASALYAQQGPVLAKPLSQAFPWVKLVAVMQEPISAAVSKLAQRRGKAARQCIKKREVFPCLERALPRLNYTTPVEAWLEAFPQDQIMLLQHESLTSPDFIAERLHSLEEFLGLEPQLASSDPVPPLVQAAPQGGESEGWPITRQQYEGLVRIVRPDAERVAALVKDHGLGDGQRWLRNWEKAWQATLNTCNLADQCMIASPI